MKDTKKKKTKKKKHEFDIPSLDVIKAIDTMLKMWHRVAGCADPFCTVCKENEDFRQQLIQIRGNLVYILENNLPEVKKTLTINDILGELYIKISKDLDQPILNLISNRMSELSEGLISRPEKRTVSNKQVVVFESSLGLFQHFLGTQKKSGVDSRDWNPVTMNGFSKDEDGGFTITVEEEQVSFKFDKDGNFEGINNYRG